MGKPSTKRALPDNEAKAIDAVVRVSPQKLNLLAELIRGKKVESALADLTFSPKRAAIIVKKVLQSAIANAENNHGLDVDNLVVAQAFVGKRMVMKRFQARARGRSGRIEKPFSQVTIIVRELDEHAAKKGRKDFQPGRGKKAQGGAKGAAKPAAKEAHTGAGA